MSGTHTGGKLAAVTNKKQYGADFYQRIGAMGGSHKGAKGFAKNRALAARAGKIGGQISRRPGATRHS